jgi:predicted transcriptional regulator of viral defense system
MYKKILEIMKNNGELITTRGLEEKGISRVYLSKTEKENVIEKIDRGIYATRDYKYDEYYIFQLKYPKTVFSYNTALYLYEMTERTPINIDVTTYREYNPHRFKEFANVHKVNKDYFDLGVSYKNTPLGAKVRVYNLERTVCDIIKDKDSIDIEIRNKAIKNCIKSKEFNASLMFEYAKKMKIYDKVKSYMEAII